MSEKLTDDEKAGLSPEEIAALEEGGDESGAGGDTTGDDDPNFGADVDPETGKPKTQATGDGTTGDGDEAGKGDGDGDGDGGDGKGDEAGKTAANGDEDIDSGSAPIVPRVHVDPVEDFDKKMTALNEELSVLAKKFSDGEITFEDLQVEQTRVHDARADLRAQRRESELAERFNQNAETDLWKREQDDFFDEHKGYRENPILMGALNTAVVRIANAPENANRTGTWILNKAHREVAKVMAVTGKEGDDKPAGDGADGKDGKDGNKQPIRKPDLKAVPRTLAGAPAAAEDVPGKGEFDELDRLTGIDYENALARLTPDQQARYLKAS